MVEVEIYLSGARPLSGEGHNAELRESVGSRGDCCFRKLCYVLLPFNIDGAAREETFGRLMW
jgi:hypothetical protein